MDSGILREFVSLVETLSFWETAEELHVSQSSLTKHIHKLEKDLGVSLFDRSTRSVTVSAFGKALYPYAQQIVKSDEEARRALAILSEGEKSTVRVLFTPAAAHYGLVDTLSYFTKRNPQIHLQITENAKVVEAMQAGECDFAFAADNDSIDTKYKKINYHRDPIMVILPKKHPLAAQESVSLADIAEERFVLHVNSRGGLQQETRLVLDLLEKEGKTPLIASTATFTSTIVKFVEHGSCIAVLPSERIPGDAAGIRAVPLSPPVYSSICLFYPANRRQPAAAKAFLAFMAEALEEE